VTVTFQGNETTLQALADRIAAEAGDADVVVSVVSKTRRTDAGLATVERGLLLETRRTGPDATLRVGGGSAVRKLGLDPMIGQARGVAVPFAKVFDLRMGGLTYFGSVIGVLTFSFFYLRFRRVSMLAMLDVVAPVLPLGLFFGRLGCLSRGCCWGREIGEGSLLPGLTYEPWSLPWQQMAAETLNCGYDILLATEGNLSAEVRTYLGPYADMNHVNGLLGPLAEATPPLHASQLYEGAAVLLIFLLVWGYRERLQTKVGMAFALLVLAQTPVRFVVEHLRRDHDVFFDLGYAFTESQLVALLLGVAAAVALAYLHARGRPVAEARLEAEPESA
jgi:prolipoprotein diacylglyceryltransferase